MVQAVSRRPLTAEAQFRSQTSSCEVFVGHSCTGTSFPPAFLFLQSVSFHQCAVLIFIYMLLLLEAQTGEVWEPPKKAISFGIGGRWLEKYLQLIFKELLRQ